MKKLRGHMPSAVDAVLCHSDPRLSLVPQSLEWWLLMVPSCQLPQGLPWAGRSLLTHSVAPPRAAQTPRLVGSGWEEGRTKAQSLWLPFGAPLKGHPSSRAPLGWAEATIATTSHHDFSFARPASVTSSQVLVPRVCPVNHLRAHLHLRVCSQGACPETPR